MGQVYLDSSFVIYVVENRGELGNMARNLLVQNGAQFCISHLVEMECLVKPFRQNDFLLENSYRKFFSDFDVLSIPVEAFERAAHIRAEHRSVRTPDALHLATACLAGCSQLWTGDADFAKVGTPFVLNVFAS